MTRARTVVFILSLLCAAVALPSCGGKKRPPPLPPPSQQPPASPQPTGKPAEQRREPGPPLKKHGRTIRLLLREGFSSVEIADSRVARLLHFEVADRSIRMFKGAGSGSRASETSTGFRLEPAEGKFLGLQGARYRGVLDVFINPLGSPVVVNEIDLEEYLRGTVPNELHPSRFPQTEALKAQTVAARTFARYHLGAFSKRGFDMYADERSQVYTGIRGEHGLADRAIEETTDVVAVYRNKPILAVYSSTCGGQTESYEAVFRSTQCPYLKGGAKCSDESSPFYSWEARTAGSKIEASLNRSSNFGRLKKLTTTKRGVSGRVVEMKLEGTKGEALLKGNQIRTVLGLRSNLITSLKPVRDKDGYVREIEVAGRGWGHGVGLCQFGAVNLATRGRSYEDILDHYYSDIRLVRQP